MRDEPRTGGPWLVPLGLWREMRRSLWRNERLISYQRNILFPQGPSTREDEILTSVPMLATRVPYREDFVPLNVYETPVKKVNKLIEN